MRLAISNNFQKTFSKKSYTKSVSFKSDNQEGFGRQIRLILPENQQVIRTLDPKLPKLGTYSTVSHTQDIASASKSVATLEDWKDFIDWRNKLCHVEETCVGSAKVIQAGSGNPEDVYITGYRLQDEKNRVNDFCMRTLTNKLIGMINLRKSENNNQPSTYVHWLLSFDKSKKGTGSDLLQLGEEYSILSGCNGNLHLKADELVKGEGSPVGFYYKKGMTTGIKDIDDAIKSEIQAGTSSKVTSVHTPVKMQMSQRGKNNWNTAISEHPIIDDTKILLDRRQSGLTL